MSMPTAPFSDGMAGVPVCSLYGPEDTLMVQAALLVQVVSLAACTVSMHVAVSVVNMALIHSDSVVAYAGCTHLYTCH